MDDFKFPDMAPVPLIIKDLTMRDYFAGLAMQGLLANVDEEYRMQWNRNYIEASEGVARASWSIADAMLKTRSEK